MHGHWTQDFRRINPRFLPMDDANSLSPSRTLRNLVNALHQVGIRLIPDIACNHSSPDINGSQGVIFDDGALLCGHNNDSSNFYQHNPEITDREDKYQPIHHETCGLGTFNETTSTAAMTSRRPSRTGSTSADAPRGDTPKHMPPWLRQEFTTDINAHKPDIFIFGEYGFGRPWDARTVAYANRFGVSSLDFGLRDVIRFAFFRPAGRRLRAGGKAAVVRSRVSTCPQAGGLHRQP